MNVPNNVEVECRKCGQKFVTSDDEPGKCPKCGGARKLKLVKPDVQE